MRSVTECCITAGVMVLSDVGLGFSRQLWQGYIVQICAVFGLLAFPAVSAIKANMVTDSEQGKLQVPRECGSLVQRGGLHVASKPRPLCDSVLNAGVHSENRMLAKGIVD